MYGGASASSAAQYRIWHAKLDIEPMDDSRNCSVMQRDMAQASLSLYLDKSGWGIVLSGDEYPGEEIMVRVDANKAHTAPDQRGFSRAAANAVITELRAGSKVKTKMIEWPSGAPVYVESSLSGISEAIDRCKNWVTKGEQ